MGGNHVRVLPEAFLKLLDFTLAEITALLKLAAD